MLPPVAAVSSLPSPRLSPTTGGRKLKAILENRGILRATPQDILPDHVWR